MALNEGGRYGCSYARAFVENSAKTRVGVALALTAAFLWGVSGAVAADAFGSEHPSAVISGPSFADEFARESPTTIVAASDDSDLARRIQDLFSGRNLRLYTNDDPVGVQLAGALKNVFAIAAGAVDGLGMGHNSLAAVMTRGPEV